MPKFKSQNEVDMEEDLNEGKGAFWFSSGLVIIMVVVIVSFIMKML